MSVINRHTRTKFDSDIIEKWLKHAKGGGSIPQFCRNESISRQTFYMWCEKYPEMQTARAMGKQWAEGWWMEQAQENLVTGRDTKFNDKIYQWTMAGRFGQSANKVLEQRIAELEERLQNSAPIGNQAIAEEPEYADSKTE